MIVTARGAHGKNVRTSSCRYYITLSGCASAIFIPRNDTDEVRHDKTIDDCRRIIVVTQAGPRGLTGRRARGLQAPPESASTAAYACALRMQ